MKIFASETGAKAADFSYKNKSSQCPACKGKGYVETSLDVAANAIENVRNAMENGIKNAY